MVIISNGFNKFHLSITASELNRRYLLNSFISGAYPTPGIKKLLNATGLIRNKKVDRLVNRGEEIDNRLVTTMWIPEAVYATGLYMGRNRWISRIGNRMERAGFRLYGRWAVSDIRRAAENGARIYHYRAGFGHDSVKSAKSAGLFTLCDHSIAHPEVLEYLVTNHGRMPDIEETYPLDPLWEEINQDIEQADAVLVNSQFVKDTFVNRGWKPRSIHVIYWGIDDQFLSATPPRVEEKGNNVAFQILFAGAFEKRKGAEELLKALRRLNDEKWELKIAGTISPDIKRRFLNDLKDERIRQMGWVSRRDLAEEMVKADAFVFPSLAEGSARVVFEALACGCYVVTTPNAGSIVEDGVHGRLVPPGNVEALASAIRQAITLPKERLRDVGRNNSRVVRDMFRQSHYGDKLLALYHELLDTK